MSRVTLIILFTVLAAAAAAGRTMDVRPGEIAAGADITGHESVLTLTGALDASDLDRLAECLTEVTTLDLSGVEIVAYRGASVGANITSAPAATLPAGIFAGLRVSRLILPATLADIGVGAFSGSAITEITIPGKVTRIGRSAFSGCASLRSITLPQSVSIIPDRMAEGCESLTAVIIPAGTTRIGSRAFFGCKALTEIEWPETLTEIGEEAFALSGLGSADMGRCASMTAIGARAFAHCASLSEAILPDGTADMGIGVFFECKSLSTVRLPASAVSIPPLTLKGARNVTALNLPTATETIDTLAFAGMSGMSTLILPPALGHIADGAFEGCSGLAEIDGNALPAVPTLGEGVWAGVHQPEVSLFVAQRLENDFLTTPQWQDFSIGHVSDISDTDAVRGRSVTAAFDGMMLTVSSTSPLVSVELYATDGRLLTIAHITDDSTTAVIDTSAYAVPFFIVRIATASGDAPVIFKLLRQS